MTAEGHDYAEKRDFIRMFINAPVEFLVSGTDDWKTGKGTNLSGGGLTFTTEHKLNNGDQVDIKLQPVTSVTPPLEAKVTVVRVEEGEDGIFSVSTKIKTILE